MANTKYYGTGRRKSSVARVYLVPGTGKITINKRDMDEYFGLETLKVVVRQPLTATETADKFDVLVNVRGGGYTGQAGAIRHGIARALLNVDADYRPVLKKAGFLTRDPRMKGVRNTVSKQLVALHSFQRDNYLERDNRIMFTNPGKSRLSGVFLYPNGLICFKVKFLKSLKPQNDASSFFDLESMQKAKICVDHFRGVPCISCGENSFAIFWLTMSKLHSIPTRLKP